MDLQFAFLLVFIVGALLVWILFRTSRQPQKNRMAMIKNHIASLGGYVLKIKQVDINSC